MNCHIAADELRVTTGDQQVQTVTSDGEILTRTAISKRFQRERSAGINLLTLPRSTPGQKCKQIGLFAMRKYFCG